VVEAAGPAARVAVREVRLEVDADAPAIGERAAAEPRVGRTGDDPGRRLSAATDDRAVLIEALPLAVVGEAGVALLAVVAVAPEGSGRLAIERDVRPQDLRRGVVAAARQDQEAEERRSGQATEG
jgi:hypothetical protein